MAVVVVAVVTTRSMAMTIMVPMLFSFDRVLKGMVGGDDKCYDGVVDVYSKAEYHSLCAKLHFA